jgi:hypothetical protein
MKQCRWCKLEKLEDQFYKRSSNSDGLYSWCKDCSRKKNKVSQYNRKDEHKKKCKEYREKNKEYLLEKAKEYYYKNREEQLKKREDYRKKNKKKISLREALKRISDEDRFEKNRKKHYEWSKDNREKLNEYQRNWYQQNKVKRRAHVILHRAINSGKVMRPEKCSQCNKKCKVDGHHEDYSKPLDVVWICRACHSRKSPRSVIKCI